MHQNAALFGNGLNLLQIPVSLLFYNPVEDDLKKDNGKLMKYRPVPAFNLFASMMCSPILTDLPIII